MTPTHMIIPYLIKNIMHLVYRSKRQTLPIVDNKLSQYHPQIHHSPTSTLFSRKKSIDVIMEKGHINDQILIYQKPVRRTMYKPHRTRKAESGYLKSGNKIQPNNDIKVESKMLTRNKSFQLTEKHQTISRRKGDSQYSPYLIAQSKKSRSNPKFKSTPETGQPQAKDWICQKFIEQEVYSVQCQNDFS